MAGPWWSDVGARFVGYFIPRPPNPIKTRDFRMTVAREPLGKLYFNPDDVGALKCLVAAAMTKRRVGLEPVTEKVFVYFLPCAFVPRKKKTKNTLSLRFEPLLVNRAKAGGQEKIRSEVVS